MEDQTQYELTEMVKAQRKRAEEDEILRQAAQIIFNRNGQAANPAEVDIRLKFGDPARVKLTVWFHT